MRVCAGRKVSVECNKQKILRYNVADVAPILADFVSVGPRW